jgi:hydrophobic/amphiphilic exporter-1 (mainly G- bacteria), HAE1 family
MKAMLQRVIKNTPAMNTLMLAIIAVGLFCAANMRRELFPEFDLEIILVTVPYPGAAPEEVEEGICQKIEEAVRSIDGIKKQTSIAKEGLGALVLELNTGVNVQKTLNEVRSEVDRIPSFPLLAEDPEVKQITLRTPAIKVGVIGPEQDDEDGQAERQLREVAELIREEMLRLPAVSQANIEGGKDYQIDVEISEHTLRRHGLSLQGVADILRRENLELPGGTIRTDSQDVLVKGKSKGMVGSEIERIPVLSLPSGANLTVADLGTVRDHFVDVDTYTRVDGRPAMVVSIDRTSTEDLILMTDAVHEYVTNREMPPGYELITWGDQSVEVRDRLDLLTRNGLQGLALVLLMLALFLNLQLAWWVAIGIPICILGACAVLFFSGQTFNMLTTFTFVMALGILVDDAIVIGENIFTHRQEGKGYLQAAIDGTVEVAPSVTASVATTIIAFMPLMFVSGVMGKFIAVMPLTMISILVFSLFESTLVLPCHLAHPHGVVHGSGRERENGVRRAFTGGALLALPLLIVFKLLKWLSYPFVRLGDVISWLNIHANGMVERFASDIYVPMLRMSLRRPAVPVSAAIVLLFVAVAFVQGGIVPFIIFPKLDSNTIDVNIIYPDGTPSSVTEAATRRLERTIQEIDEELAAQGEPILRLTRRSIGYVTVQQGPALQSAETGSHLGSVTAELRDTSERNIDSLTILSKWREAAGSFPGVESISFVNGETGPGGTPIEFKLLAPSDKMESLEAAVERTKAYLAEFPGVFDISDDSYPGKWEYQIRVKPDAIAMGVPLQDLAETVRASFYGEEVMRLQRGRHEVKLMVRYPQYERQSLTGLDQIRVRTQDGAERPLTELAEVAVNRGYSEINRVNQSRSITISADLDESQANARSIVGDLQKTFMPGLLAEYPGVTVRWEGQQEQTAESVLSLAVGLGIALAAMFVLLTFQFNSYFQPFLIMGIIPFGIAGAVIGHAIMGLPLTIFSLFGLVTLTGVVVNDSIVLIDFINHRSRKGVSLEDALLESGRRRLRPIFLTSVTTIAGLLPLLFERSFQAQILVPMAVSICFGLLFSTLLILVLVPIFYLVHARLTGTADLEDMDEEKSAERAGDLVAV